MFFCSYNAESIRQGNHLNKAIERTADDFLQNRMKNRIKKVIGANWVILFEDPQTIYYGYPLTSFFRDGTFVKEFYKTNKSEVQNKFPLYQKIDGIEFRRILLTIIKEKINLSPQIYNTFNYQFEFLDQTIVHLVYNIHLPNQTIQKTNYKLVFDPKDLKLTDFKKE